MRVSARRLCGNGGSRWADPEPGIGAKPPDDVRVLAFAILPTRVQEAQCLAEERGCRVIEGSGLGGGGFERIARVLGHGPSPFAGAGSAVSCNRAMRRLPRAGRRRPRGTPYMPDRMRAG